MFSLQPLFNRQPEPMIGLDISASSIKLVELGKNKVGQYVLERCAIQPLERGWIVDGSIEKFDEVAEAINCILKTYTELRQEDESFLEAVRRLGITPFQEKVYANH